MRINRSLRPGPRVAGLLALALAALLVAGCGNKGVTTPKLPPLSRVTLVPPTDTLVVGQHVQFTAVAYDTGGTAVSGAAIAWRSTDEGVCTVTGTGFATGAGEGSALIIAAAGGKADTASVYVKGGTSGWYTQTSGTIQNLNAVYFRPDGRNGFAVGNAGTIVATTDAGVTWAARTSNTTNDLESVWFADANTGWVVGKSGTIVKTVDGGATWVRQTNGGTSNDLYGVRFVDGLHGWAVGTVGEIARTADGGATWTRRFPPTSNTLYGVSFADTLNGWACGGIGVILGTHDGGVSWYLVQPALTTQTLKSVARIGNARAWAVGAQGVVAMSAPSADSLTWSLGTVGATNQLNGVHMVDALAGFAVGANPAGLVLHTVDGGATWDPQTANSGQALNGVYFVDALRGWAVGAAGRIVHTSNGGAP